jgi:thioredoxin 1
MKVNWMRNVFRLSVLFALAGLSVAQTALPTPDDKPFAPFEQWQECILKGDADGLKALYSRDPVAQIKVGTDEMDADGAVRFWMRAKLKSMKVDILQKGAPQVQPGAYQVLFQAELVSAAGPKEQTLYITEGQLWHQEGDQWRIVVSKRTEASRLEQPASNQKDIYPAGVDAHKELKAAIEKGGKEHKRILIVFGANWCYDCHVLDLAFERQDIAPVLAANFEMVNVDVGEGDKNQDLMKQYEVPMDRGIPALAVLDSDGKLIYSQKNGEFEKARALGPEDLLDFLNKWKPQKG